MAIIKGDTDTLEDDILNAFKELRDSGLSSSGLADSDKMLEKLSEDLRMAIVAYVGSITVETKGITPKSGDPIVLRS